MKTLTMERLAEGQHWIVMFPGGAGAWHPLYHTLSDTKSSAVARFQERHPTQEWEESCRAASVRLVPNRAKEENDG